MFRHFPTFSRICIFFLLTPPLLWSALFYSFLLSASDHLCFSSVHIVGSLTSTLPSLNIYIYRSQVWVEVVWQVEPLQRFILYNDLCMYIYIYIFIYLFIYTYQHISIDPRYGLRSSGRWSHGKGFYYIMIFVYIYIYIYIQLSTYISIYIYIYLYRSQVWVEVVWQVEPLQGFILYNQKCMYMYLYINTSQHISLYIHIYK